MRRPIMLAAAAAVVLAAGFAAAATLASGSTAKSGSGTLVQLRKTTLGRVLVDSRGHTLYLFEADKGRTSACYGKCATFWPPLTTKTKATAGAGVRAALLGTTKRKDGTRQVTYAGHPLYRFLKDKRAGQTTGQNLDFFGGEWYVLAASGRKIERKASSDDSSSTGTTTTTTTTTDDSGGGGGYGGGGGDGY